MKLSEADQTMLAGESGEARAVALGLVVAAAEAGGAERLLDISGAHIDSCLYHGPATLDFAVMLTGLGARVSVPTTLNVSSLDLLHPELYRGDPDTGRQARALMDAYVEMGCRPTWTCAPYQLLDRPSLGDQVAWGESNAIVFANSVLGARTSRYGDFLDICCAITGRAPAFDLHTDEGRLATVMIEVSVPDTLLDEDLFYALLGHVLGKLAGTDVAVIVGLDRRADDDRLRALGAAAASSGAVGMFHVEGVTPEAETRELALGGRPPRRAHVVDRDSLVAARRELSRGSTELVAVSVGTPHASLSELKAIAGTAAGRRTSLPFYVSTGRDVLAEANQLGIVEAIERFGATIVVDTCTYITPILEVSSGAVMTNSGKWAYYAPGNLGVEVVLAGLEDCIESAVAGHMLVTGPFA